MKRALPLGLCLSVLLALILRVPDLDQRPFHNDEAVNAVKAGELLEAGTYRYDPHEFHGPSLHYATWMLSRLTSWPSFEEAGENRFRWLTVLFGVSLIPLLWLVRDALGRAGVVWAGLLTSLSPVLVFFSRDYIHEMLLVVFTFCLVGCGWRYLRHPNWKWAVAAGVAAGLMHATKETFLLNLAAMAMAYGLLRPWSASAAETTPPRSRRWLAHGALMLGAWTAVSLGLFSSLGQNPSGPMDSLRTYLPWLGRAGGGSPHVHPVWFYAERLFWRPSGHPLPWTELGILILAGAGARAGFTNRGLGDSSGPFVRWLTFYSGILFVIYSLIPYKTPWCILGAAHGMVLLAGVGMAAVWRIAWKLPQRVALGAFTVVLLPWLCVQAWALSHSQTSTRGNPWAYADTTPDVRNLLGLVEELAAHSPRHRGMNIQVLCEEDDYWPLPYYLRAYDHTGWWDQLPPEPLAPVLIASPGLASVLGESSDHWQVGLFQLRHGVFLSCHVEKGLWDAFLDARSSD